MTLGIRSLLRRLLDWFDPEPSVYAHRNRTVETVVREQGDDIDELDKEMCAVLRESGRVAAVNELRHRYHLPLAATWRYIDRLDH